MGARSKIALIFEAKHASKVAAEVDHVDGSVRKLDKSTKKTDKTSGKVAAGWRRMGGAAAVAAGGALLVAGAIGGNVLDEYREAYKVGKQTNNVIQTTGGVANVTAGHVGSLSQAISNKVGIDDEEIQKGSNLLLTFKNIHNELGKGNAIFDRATQAAVDLSASGFGSIDSASKMLGKALNDPVKGISALGRAGVTFTDGQKKQIKAMVKSGDTLGAQKLIMKEVESQVKGSAAAQADSVDRLKTNWANFLEWIGTKVVPLFNRMVDYFLDHVVPALKAVGGWVSRNSDWLVPLAAAIGTAIGVIKIWIAITKIAAGAQLILNAALATNPIVLIVAAIAALVVGFIIAYKKITWFRNAVNAVGHVFKSVGKAIVKAVSSALGFVRKHWKTILAVLTGPIGIAVLLISRNFKRIVGFAKSLPGKVKHALSGLWDGMTHGFKSAINWIIRKWNGFELSVGPIKIPGPLPDIPKVTFGTPNIPLLAQGGQVHGVGSRWISGEGGAPELGEVTSDGVKVTPLAGDSGSGPTAVIHLHVNMDGRKVGEGVKRVALRDLLAASPA